MVLVGVPFPRPAARIAVSGAALTWFREYCNDLGLYQAHGFACVVMMARELEAAKKAGLITDQWEAAWADSAEEAEYRARDFGDGYQSGENDQD